jgi:hypothetical protein
MALVNACGDHRDKVVTFRERTGGSERTLLHANTQTRKYTNTQIHNYINTQIHNGLQLNI